MCRCRLNIQYYLVLLIAHIGMEYFLKSLYGLFHHAYVVVCHYRPFMLVSDLVSFQCCSAGAKFYNRLKHACVVRYFRVISPAQATGVWLRICDVTSRSLFQLSAA